MDIEVGGDAGDQPAAPDRHDDGVKLVQLSSKLDGHGPLPGDHARHRDVAGRLVHRDIGEPRRPRRANL